MMQLSSESDGVTALLESNRFPLIATLLSSRFDSVVREVGYAALMLIHSGLSDGSQCVV